MRYINEFCYLLKWQALRMKTTIPFLCVLQVIIGIGAVFGISFIIPDADEATILYSITGIPIITILMVGLSLLPQIVADDIEKEIIDYMWTLAISKTAFLAADMTIWIISTIPGIVLSLITSRLYYGFEFEITVFTILIFLLVMFSSCIIGYCIAHMVKSNQITVLITSFILFSMFLFSPIIYPISRLPQWLRYVHEVLPIKHMAELIRMSISTFDYKIGNSFIVICCWVFICSVIIRFSVTGISIKNL